MRAIAASVFMASSFASLMSQGLVTLEGRQFKVGAQDYYPIIMNFSVSAAINAVPDHDNPPANPGSDVYLTTDGHYGPENPQVSTVVFDCQDGSACDADLLDYFDRAKDMGFNALRIVGMAPYFRHREDLGLASDPASRVFSYKLFGNDGGEESGRAFIDLVGPDFQDAQSVAHFDRIEHLLDLADAADMKAILLCVERTRESDGPPGTSGMYPTYDMEAAVAYAEYLTALAGHLNGHPALLAYDLFNEPSFAGINVIGGTNNEKWRKSDYCVFTTIWREAIRSADPDHLITLGGVGLGEATSWDISALKIDFYSLHIYPWARYDADYTGSYDYADVMSRYQGQLHWMSRQCPMPWIIGETGFSGTDATGPYPHTDPDPSYHAFPYMHGTESEQADFALASLQLTRDCGGSGWSWWQFQEIAWWGLDDIGSGVPPLEPKNMQELYYGLFHLGDGTSTWVAKPAAAVIDNFPVPPMPASPGAQPANYYNPYSFPTTQVLGLAVEDDLGIPIENAFATIVWYNEDDISTEPDLLSGSSTDATAHTFSDATGIYIYYEQPQIIGFYEPAYTNIEVTAIGHSSESRGTWTGTSITDGETFVLARPDLAFHGTVSGLTVSSETGIDHKYFEGWDDLSTWNMTMTAAPDPGATEVMFRARSTVLVGPEFHAQEGSEVHIHLEQTWPVCSGNNYHMMVAGNQGMNSSSELPDIEAREKLELQFLVDAREFRIWPNPATDMLTVQTTNTPGQLLLTDPSGRLVNTWSLTRPQLELDLHNLSAGVYSLTWTSSSGCESLSFIKQQ